MRTKIGIGYALLVQFDIFFLNASFVTEYDMTLFILFNHPFEGIKGNYSKFVIHIHVVRQFHVPSIYKL